MNQYIRDGRAPIPETEATSKLMRSNKGKDTKPELALRRALRDIGLQGYRLHWRGVPGRPDIAFPRHKLAIFVNGDFWHRCPVCNLRMPKTHTEFWQAKLERNVQRDSKKIAEIESKGWTVLVCWEHEIRNDVQACALRIKEIIRDMS